MSNIELYKPLLEISLAISECKDELTTNPGWSRKSKLKKAIENLEQKLNEESSELIDRTVNTWNSDQPLNIFLAEEFASLKQDADESWHNAIDDVGQRITKLALSESSKSPMRRKVEKNGVWIAIGVIAITMLSLKWYWLVEVDQPIETVTGTIQRAAALDKLLDYDDSMDTRVRRGGWLKGILFWPAEPTEKEIEHASEFLWAAVEIYDYLNTEGAICGSKLSHNSNDENYNDELEIAKIPLTKIISGDAENFESGPLLIASTFTTEFSCQ